ncbi:MAG: hypothetical protein AAGJ93_00770 [Bacteroidota bacterium]
MKQILLTLMVVFLGGSVLSAEEDNHYFVKTDGEGSGTSWDDALNNLQAALEIAVSGDLIWVAQGTYLPTEGADRTASFIIPDGVTVLGGFAGTEITLEERDYLQTPTILSGDIGEADVLEDNSYTVVYFSNVSASTVLDGFVITEGYAGGISEGADVTICGGGIFNNGEYGLSSPTIKNCILLNNHSREGGALYNYAYEGEASPNISDCTFIDNRSDFNGGAVFNDGNLGICNPNFTNCRFSGNESMYGAGLLNRGLYGTCQPILTNCSFTDNFSVVRGGAIYNQREGRGVCEAQIANCVFEDNGATIGDGDVDQTIKMINEESATPRRSGIRVRTAEAISY